MRVWTTISILLLVTGGLQDLRAQHLAQKMGLGKDAKRLILHGDDLGMCRAANTAAELGFEAPTRNSMDTTARGARC